MAKARMAPNQAIVELLRRLLMNNSLDIFCFMARSDEERIGGVRGFAAGRPALKTGNGKTGKLAKYSHANSQSVRWRTSGHTGGRTSHSKPELGIRTRCGLEKMQRCCPQLLDLG